MAVDTIIARFELQTAQAQAALAEMNKRLDATEAELKKVAAQSKKTGAGFLSLKDQIASLGATMGVVFSAQQIVSFTKDAIQAAADMGETIGKVGEIFKEEASYIEQWANTAATTMGQTKQQALDAAANFAIFGKGAGLTGQELADFAVELTNLASDLSSFNNTTPEQAINALGAALRGESEPIRAYGVLLDDMTLRQEAVRMGLIDTTKQALTPQQRVLAAHAAILKQTTTAQGDFARTADSLSNKQKILSAEFTDLQVKIGEKLAPAFEKLVDGALALVRNLDADTIMSFAKAIGVAGGAFAAWKIGQQAQQVGSFTGAINSATGGIKAMGKAVAANPLGALLATMTAIVAIGTPIVKNMLGISDALDSIEDSANQAAKSLRAEQIEMNNMLDALKKTNPETAERQRLIDEINSKYGLTLENQGSEIANLRQLEAAQRELNAQYEEKIALRIKEAKMEAAIQKQAELELQLQDQLNSGWEKFYTVATTALGASGGFFNMIGENTGIRQTQKELERVKALISSLSQEGIGEGGLAGLLTPDAPAAAAAEETITDAAKKAMEERLKLLEQYEEAVRKANEEIYTATLDAIDKELFAVEKKYSEQIAEARKYADESTAEGRRWLAVATQLEEALGIETQAIRDKYRQIELQRQDAFRQEQIKKEREAREANERIRMEFLASREAAHVQAYDKEMQRLNELVQSGIITWAEYYKFAEEADKAYRAKVEEANAALAASRMAEIQRQTEHFTMATQLFGETLTNIMQITAGNNKAFADFQKFVGLAELAVSQAVAIANAVRVVSSTSLTPIDLIANIAAVTAAISSVFAGIFSTINQSQTPEVPEFESYAKGTAFLERNGAPKGIDTIPIMANEGEAIIPTEANAAAPGLAKAWIDGNLDDYIFRNYVIPALEEQAAEAAAKRMEAMSLSQAHVAGFDDFRLYVQSKKQVGYLEQIAANTKRAAQSRKRFYS